MEGQHRYGETAGDKRTGNSRETYRSSKRSRYDAGGAPAGEAARADSRDAQDAVAPARPSDRDHPGAAYESSRRPGTSSPAPGQGLYTRAENTRSLSEAAALGRTRQRSSNGHAPAVIQTRASPPFRPSDKDGHYVFELGESLIPRYKILSKLGEGTFGQVLECWDREAREYLAIKVIRNASKYREAAMIEQDVLLVLAKHDPNGQMGCVLFKDCFDFRGHICLAFERLGLSLFDFMRKNHYCPFSLNIVRDFAAQILKSVAYMHGLKLVHTDLKPENVLLVSSEYVKVPLPGSKKLVREPKHTRIKLIDFGSATFEDQYHATVVSTRHYRAPEVILGLGWSYPCDLWSVGCILVEFITGSALFQTHQNLEHLAMMERILGPIPQHMIEKADRHIQPKYFRHKAGSHKARWELDWPEGASSRDSIHAVRKLGTLWELLNADCTTPSELRSCHDLIAGLLRYDPVERLTAHEALQHPFLAGATATSPPAPPPPPAGSAPGGASGAGAGGQQQHHGAYGHGHGHGHGDTRDTP